MRMYDVIKQKRDGHTLTIKEIDYFIQGYTNGEIPDYQASALLMAIYLKGMNPEEAANLTNAMVYSGDQIDLSEIQGIKVDKHSTGGVGDTTTLILAPLVASIGIPVAKMSGRGLGHTGGTIDKMEAIPGYKSELSSEEFIQLVNKNKLAIIGQSGNLTPADKLLYSLRDVTATVDSIPLIASSVMSKKIAAGSDAIVLDIKTGSGAFMEKLEDAENLAQTMVDIGVHVGKRTIAIISDMNQPLGYAIGNALEVKEALNVLHGEGPEDLKKLCLELGSYMAVAANVVKDVEEGRILLAEQLHNGAAFQKFKDFVYAQGGDVTFLDHPEKFLEAQYKTELLSNKSGYVSAMKSEEIGHCAMLLGAGRQTKDSIIDQAVGIICHKKIGDSVDRDEVLLTIHSNKPNVTEIKKNLEKSILISKNNVKKPTFIYKVLE